MSHMGLWKVARRFLGHGALATCAVALGVSASRYTDLARYDRTRGEAPAFDATLTRSSAAARQVASAEPVLNGTPPAPSAAKPAPAPAKPKKQAAMGETRGLGEHVRDGRIMRGSTPHRLILFTFDDGPDRYTTPILLDRLDAAGIRAVFFLTGENLRGTNLAERKNQAIAREALRRGHTLASHGMHHRQLPLLSDYEVQLEVGQTEAMFKRVLGARPFLFRPPGGAHSPRVDRLLSERGYTTVLWNLGAGDFQVRTAADVFKTWQAVFERRRSQGDEGGIILLHDTYAWSVDAFQLIVRDLLARNCELLERGEELYDFVDDPKLFFQARAGADPSQESEPVRLPASVLEARQAPLRAETAQRCSALARRD